jgi:FkbM family methyltransferase
MFPIVNVENAHFLARCLRYRFRTERLQLKTLMQLDLKGGTAIDIGANKGIYSFWLSRAVGPTGHVLAFEPQPEMARYIDDRKARFRLDNVVTINAALSDAPGTALLARQRIGDGSASLESARAHGEQIEVVVKTLDELAGVSNVKFIKCDVEGHEIRVFEGARRLIAEHQPVVQFESTAPEASRLFDFFGQLGYFGVMFLNGDYWPCAVHDTVPHYKFGLGGHRDYIFFPSSAIGTTIPERVFRLFP